MVGNARTHADADSTESGCSPTAAMKTLSAPRPSHAFSIDSIMSRDTPTAPRSPSPPHPPRRPPRPSPPPLSRRLSTSPSPLGTFSHNSPLHVKEEQGGRDSSSGGGSSSHTSPLVSPPHSPPHPPRWETRRHSPYPRDAVPAWKVLQPHGVHPVHHMRGEDMMTSRHPWHLTGPSPYSLGVHHPGLMAGLSHPHGPLPYLPSVPLQVGGGGVGRVPLPPRFMQATPRDPREVLALYPWLLTRPPQHSLGLPHLAAPHPSFTPIPPWTISSPPTPHPHEAQFLPAAPLNSDHSRLFDHPSHAGFLFQAFRKPKRIRTAFSPSQLVQLEQAFEKNQYVVGQERKQLASKLQLSETQVKVWFQNRRTKFKRLRSEGEQSNMATDSHPASPGTAHTSPVACPEDSDDEIAKEQEVTTQEEPNLDSVCCEEEEGVSQLEVT